MPHRSLSAIRFSLVSPFFNSSFSRKKLDEIRSIAPEPPRRHCSNSTLRPNGSLDQICEDYEAITLSGASSVRSQDIYGYTAQVQGQVHGAQRPPFYDSCTQMSLSMPSAAQQPIYANYNAVVSAIHPQKSLPNIQMTSSNHIQTRAEVHAEKIPFSNSNDSKVSSDLLLIATAPELSNLCVCFDVVFIFHTVKFQHRFNRSTAICQ